MTWRVPSVANTQWCPHCRLAETVQIVELECCHPPGAQNPQIRQEAIARTANNREFLTTPLDEIDLIPSGTVAYSKIGCIADLCSQWEISLEIVPEGEEQPGRCGIPDWTIHQQKRT